jgi:hypothetical protein
MGNMPTGYSKSCRNAHQLRKLRPMSFMWNDFPFRISLAYTIETPIASAILGLVTCTRRG